MASGSKAAGLRQFSKCVVRNVILSIGAHFIVVAHYYSFVCYRNLSFNLSALSNEKM